MCVCFFFETEGRAGVYPLEEEFCEAECDSHFSRMEKRYFLVWNVFAI